MAIFKDYIDALYSNDFSLLEEQMEPAFLELTKKRVAAAHKKVDGDWHLQYVKGHETEFFLYDVQSYLLSGVSPDRRVNKPDTDFAQEVDVKFKLKDQDYEGT